MVAQIVNACENSDSMLKIASLLISSHANKGVFNQKLEKVKDFLVAQNQLFDQLHKEVEEKAKNSTSFLFVSRKQPETVDKEAYFSFIFNSLDSLNRGLSDNISNAHFCSLPSLLNKAYSLLRNKPDHLKKLQQSFLSEGQITSAELISKTNNYLQLLEQNEFSSQVFELACLTLAHAESGAAGKAYIRSFNNLIKENSESLTQDISYNSLCETLRLLGENFNPLNKNHLASLCKFLSSVEKEFRLHMRMSTEDARVFMRHILKFEPFNPSEYRLDQYLDLALRVTLSNSLHFYSRFITTTNAIKEFFGNPKLSILMHVKDLDNVSFIKGYKKTPQVVNYLTRLSSFIATPNTQKKSTQLAVLKNISILEDALEACSQSSIDFSKDNSWDKKVTRITTMLKDSYPNISEANLIKGFAKLIIIHNGDILAAERFLVKEISKQDDKEEAPNAKSGAKSGAKYSSKSLPRKKN